MDPNFKVGLLLGTLQAIAAMVEEWEEGGEDPTQALLDGIVSASRRATDAVAQEEPGFVTNTLRFVQERNNGHE